MAISAGFVEDFLDAIGSFPAADSYRYPRSKHKHRHDFHSYIQSFIAAMGKRFPISLATTAGHPAMIGSGPIGGHRHREHGCVS